MVDHQGPSQECGVEVWQDSLNQKLIVHQEMCYVHNRLRGWSIKGVIDSQIFSGNQFKILEVSHTDIHVLGRTKNITKKYQELQF